MCWCQPVMRLAATTTFRAAVKENKSTPSNRSCSSVAPAFYLDPNDSKHACCWLFAGQDHYPGCSAPSLWNFVIRGWQTEHISVARQCALCFVAGEWLYWGERCECVHDCLNMWCFSNPCNSQPSVMWTKRSDVELLGQYGRGSWLVKHRRPTGFSYGFDLNIYMCVWGCVCTLRTEMHCFSHAAAVFHRKIPTVPGAELPASSFVWLCEGKHDGSNCAACCQHVCRFQVLFCAFVLLSLPAIEAHLWMELVRAASSSSIDRETCSEKVVDTANVYSNVQI